MGSSRSCWGMEEPQRLSEPSLSCSISFLASGPAVHAAARCTVLASLSSWLFLLVPLAELRCGLHLPPVSRKTGRCLLEVLSFSLREGHSVPLGSLALSLLSFHLWSCKMGILKYHPPGVCAVLYEIGQGRAANTAELTGQLAVPLMVTQGRSRGSGRL